jgi:hypothetical protein
MVDPLGGGARDLGAPIINVKNVDGRPPGPHGGVSGLHSGSKRCDVNLHVYDRQKIILRMGPTPLCLVLLWLKILSRLTGHG